MRIFFFYPFINNDGFVKGQIQLLFTIISKLKICNFHTLWIPASAGMAIKGNRTLFTRSSFLFLQDQHFQRHLQNKCSHPGLQPDIKYISKIQTA